MELLDNIVRSDYHYQPSEEEWHTIWLNAKKNCGKNLFINQLYDFWCNRGYLSPKQMYHLIKNAYPTTQYKLLGLDDE